MRGQWYCKGMGSAVQWERELDRLHCKCNLIETRMRTLG